MPMALGLRQSTLTQKASAWLQSVLRECPQSELDAFLNSMVSVTTDLGTELGLAQFSVPSFDDILPEWAVSAPLACDGEGWIEVPPQPPNCHNSGWHSEAEEQGLSERRPQSLDDACMDLEFDGLCQWPDNPSVLPKPVVRLGVEAAEAEPPAACALEAEAPGNQAPSDSGAEVIALVRLMPRAIPVPGILHIVHNLLHDVNEKMSHWDSFFPELRNLSRFLERRLHRERFVEMCLRPSGYACAEATWRRIEERTFPSLHEPPGEVS